MRDLPHILSILLFASACSGRVPEQARLTTTDSAGIRIVRIPGLRHLDAPVWSTTLAFSTEHEDSLGLGSNVQAVLAPNRTLLVTGPKEVYILDTAGRVTGQLGRDGDGPGEFRAPHQLRIAGDSTLLVGDWTGRLTRLRLTGEGVRVVPRLIAPAGIELDPVSVLPDGRILVTYWQQRPNRGGNPGIAAGTVERDSAPLTFYDSLGRATGRLGLWHGLERAVVDLDGEPARLPLPFARSVVYDGRGARTVIGPSDSLDLSLYSGTKLVLRMTAPHDPRPPDAAMTSAWEQAIRTAYPDIATTYLKAIRSARTVPSVAAVGGVVLDDRGNVWLGAWTAAVDPTRRWWIFSDQGEAIGRLELPALTDPLLPGRIELLDVAGDRLVLLRITESGEAVVEVRTIHRTFTPVLPPAPARSGPAPAPAAAR